MDECIFCKIVKNEIPSKKVYEDDDVIAFLDINPANKGHCLVASKKHYENIYDVDDDVLQKMIIVVKTLSQRAKNSFEIDGLNVVQNNGKHAGQLVNHIHFHIIPRYEGDKVIITYQRNQVTEQELDEVKNKLTEEKSPNYDQYF